MSSKITTHNVGQVGEYRVASDLARSGFTVALPTGNAQAIDVLAYRSGLNLAIQVKSAKGLTHQFNLDKFLHIDDTAEGGQIINGPSPHMDPNVIIVFVWVGDTPDNDEFAWGDLRGFADLLLKSHGAYLAKHGGRRPGSNPKSRHCSLHKRELQAAFPASTLTDYLATLPAT